MSDHKVRAGRTFPSITVTALDGSQHDLAERNEGRWKMVVVYRGRHCPLCTKYLRQQVLPAQSFSAVCGPICETICENERNFSSLVWELFVILFAKSHKKNSNV